MDTRARGRGRAGARGGRAVARGGRVGGRGVRGRGRGLGAESVESAAQSVSHSVATASESSLGASVLAGAGRGRGVPVGPGGGAAAAPGHDDQVVGLLTQLLARFPERAPGVAPVADMQQRAAEVEQPRAAVAVPVPSYLEVMGHMQRIGTPSFEGRVGPAEADEWRLRVERNFRSIRCPAEYQVELAIHYLCGDAHLWWRAIEARRAVWTWGEFLAEFNAKYFPQEARDRLQLSFMSLEQGGRSVREYDAEFGRLLVHSGRDFEDERTLMQRFLQGLRLSIRSQCRGARYASRAELVELAASIEEDQREQVGSFEVPPVVAPVAQPRGQQQQPQQHRRDSGSSKGGRPAQGQKRRRDDPSRTSSGSHDTHGCFGCGSADHRVANCPKVSREAKVCFHCREPGHIRPMCPKLQQPVVAAVQSVGEQPSGQVAAVQQSVGQIGPAPRVYSSAEFGQGSRAGQITGKF